MTAIIIDGINLAKRYQEQTRAKILLRTVKGDRPPGLSVIMVGNDPASEIYVAKKRAVAAELGIVNKDFNLPENTPETALTTLINTLNKDRAVDGILVQLPLPRQIDCHQVFRHIAPDKDVDGLTPYNLGCLALGQPNLSPCTPRGIMLILESIGAKLEGMNAVMVGISNIVGKPMVMELLQAKATVEVCHVFTRDLSSKINRADLVISAVGMPHLIRGEWIKEGAIVIDVGITRFVNKVRGDVEFAVAKERASFITPVPGGVGPMTVAVLMANALRAAESHRF